MSYDRPRLLAIDPWDCGCTECLTGEYKPLRMASASDIAALLCGELAGNTSATFQVEIRYEVRPDSDGPLSKAAPTAATVSCDDRTWTLDRYAARAVLGSL
ncbi:hypothetical protein ACIBQX_11550 [Nonomuraea sp. NPDC049714]|uniref:hypothetical protein n=1 Tax=Nonomuraea sp. NPDC049714 TaxID=3364357 RepID=UPI003790756B